MLPKLNDRNQLLYSTRGIVNYYTQLKQIQPAEQTLITHLHPQLPTMRMLDIGVGGGRTTQYFAPLVQNYIGIDYSAAMIAGCQQRFASTLPKARFEVCDARDMSRFEDQSFDLVLFSFNGIDFVSHQERLQVLQEICRISKPGGYFYFSSHNLQGMEQEFSWQTKLSLNPVSSYINLVMLLILRSCNYSLSLTQLQASQYAILRDESHNFRLKTYYVRPQAQIQQLATNFSSIQVFSWRTGLELKTEEDLQSNTDMWLYYLCRI